MKHENNLSKPPNHPEKQKATLLIWDTATPPPDGVLASIAARYTCVCD